MSYYRECRFAFGLIEKLIMKASGKITEKEIVYAVTDKYDIGRMTISKRLVLLKDLTKITIDENGRIWWVDGGEADDGKHS